VPKYVFQHMIKYYNYLWNYNKGVTTKSLFVDLPVPLRAEIAVAVTRPMWSKVGHVRVIYASRRRSSMIRNVGLDELSFNDLEKFNA